MKTFFITVALFLSLCATVFAAPTSVVSSGIQNADAAITTMEGYLTGCLIVTNGTNDADIIVYDNATTASGTILWQGKVAGASNFGGATWEIPVRYNNGIYVNVTGTGATYIIYYRAGY